MKHLSRIDIEGIAEQYVKAYMALPEVRDTHIYVLGACPRLGGCIPSFIV